MKDIRIENLTKKYQSVEGFRIIVRPSGTEAKLRIMTEGSKPRFLNDYFRIIYRRIELHT
jgi:phosphoglucosamine mutase